MCQQSLVQILAVKIQSIKVDTVLLCIWGKPGVSMFFEDNLVFHFLRFIFKIVEAQVTAEEHSTLVTTSKLT